MTVAELTQKQIADVRRQVTAARLGLRRSWAGAVDAEAAATLEQCEKLLTGALEILGEEPGDEPQAWEAYPLDRNEVGKCVTSPGDLPTGMREKHCPWEVGYGCVIVVDWEAQDGPRLTLKCAAEGRTRRGECWAHLLATWEAR